MFSFRSARILAVFAIIAGVPNLAVSQNSPSIQPVSALSAPAAGPGDLHPELMPPYEHLLHRLEAAEDRIRQLESEEAEGHAGSLEWLTNRFLVYDPEIAVAREQMEAEAIAVRRAEEELFEPTDEPKIPAYRKPREKKWYEKYSLRGYTQFRDNETVFEAKQGAPAQHIGDGSVGDSKNFLFRRARLILQGDVSSNVFFYFQNDFAVTPPGSTDATHFAQIRDLYADIYLDGIKEHRFRVGQSKVPFGWENLQSSSNRAPLDRNDALNSAVPGERDLGVFYYWTPVYAQKMFRYVLAENYKGSGNFGVFGLGAYNGQAASNLELNNNIHVISRFTWPFLFENGQIVELGTAAYTGRFTVLSSTFRTLGLGSSTRPQNTLETGSRQGIREERIGCHAIWYPQPIGLQAEWNVGRGPALNDIQTAVEERALQGGYIMAISKWDTSHCGTFFPFVKWQYYEGGIKAARNAPYAKIDETELGVEWQITPAAEFTVEYTVTDRTNTTTVDRAGFESYRQFVGQLVRLQFQVNY